MSKEAVTAARTAADNFKKANKGKSSPALENNLAVEQAKEKAAHEAKGQPVPQWAKNRN